MFKRIPTWLKPWLKEARRMASWLIVTLSLTAIIALLAPQQIGVTLYKLSLVTAAAWAGYWIDRSLFPYARPHALSQNLQDSSRYTAAMIRRAIIVAAAMLAMGLAA